MTIDMGDLALLILFVLCLAIFVYLLIKVLKGRAIRIDEVGYLMLVERLRSPVLTAAMKAASSLASLPFVVGVLAAAMLWAPNWAHVVWAAFNVGAISAIDQLLKVLVRRPRPQGFRLVEAPGLSFPSGHSMAAMAFYGYVYGWCGVACVAFRSAPPSRLHLRASSLRWASAVSIWACTTFRMCWAGFACLLSGSSCSCVLALGF